MIRLVAGRRCRPIARLTSPGQHAGCSRDGRPPAFDR